ncbi:tRNA (adenosine(37)-N6)-threonylcarbamoyltransferase complex ATPase subunit type 1 TsaE [Candidatus Roizmanbacteria bacterium]|nr:tRNA (adenosine(37)-N6)-threonylcarbamoyltransferase complex ATPase subunit type 1 TsaE [Candidatus Roizmanbacteria bacterium]
MKKIITTNFEETQQLGFDLAKSLKGGVVCLYGDLGSGKTTFVQGLARGLGIEKRIISPTFIIMRTYEIEDKNFYHVDLYRIENEKDVEGLGLLEIMKDDASIVVIEWPEKIENLLPEKRKDIFFKYLDGDRREIVFE